MHLNLTCRYAYSRLKSTHEVTTHETHIELMTHTCIYTASITNIVTHRQLHYGYTVFLFTYSASASSPPRITGTVTRSVTNTILTRWDTNSWRKNPTDCNVSRSLWHCFWLLLVTLTGVRIEPRGKGWTEECFVLSTYSTYLTAFKNFNWWSMEVALCHLSMECTPRVFWQL